MTTKLLVTLTPEDLATDELRKARQSINVEDRESRRTDWLEEHKGKIQVKKNILLLLRASFRTRKLAFDSLNEFSIYVHFINVHFVI